MRAKHRARDVFGPGSTGGFAAIITLEGMKTMFGDERLDGRDFPNLMATWGRIGACESSMAMVAVRWDMLSKMFDLVGRQKFSF